MGGAETELAPALGADPRPVFLKHGYSAFTPEFERYFAELKASRLYLCGIATDGCVLKTAVDAFERDIEPIVVVDACASHAGREIHQAGLCLLERFIGARQLRESAAVLASLGRV